MISCHWFFSVCASDNMHFVKFHLKIFCSSRVGDTTYRNCFFTWLNGQTHLVHDIAVATNHCQQYLNRENLGYEWAIQILRHLSLLEKHVENQPLASNFLSSLQDFLFARKWIFFWCLDCIRIEGCWPYKIVCGVQRVCIFSRVMDLIISRVKCK